MSGLFLLNHLVLTTEIRTHRDKLLLSLPHFVIPGGLPDILPQNPAHIGINFSSPFLTS
jgi:hypothetical protein